jgi:hypothetical protein
MRKIMMRFVRAGFISIFCSLALAACAPGVTPVYTPNTTAELKGEITVNNFDYLKAHASDDNEIGCWKMNCLHLTETVSDYVTNAVRREFRQAGLSLKNSQCSLTGQVNELSINPGWTSVTYKSDMRYTLSDHSGKTLFDNNYVVEFDAAGTYDANLAFNSLNKALSDNIDKLLNDAGFTAAIRKSCQ